MSNDQGSPPTGSTGRSMALPAAASWYVNSLCLVIIVEFVC
jgi:anion-transporting  ArsA/GET3 family ATPase